MRVRPWEHGHEPRPRLPRWVGPVVFAIVVAGLAWFGYLCDQWRMERFAKALREQGVGVPAVDKK